MQGSILFFDEASVTATEHILMAAVLAEGTTEIRNAASEPHVQELAEMLVEMGADIEGIKTNTLVVTGVEAPLGASPTASRGITSRPAATSPWPRLPEGDLTVEGIARRPLLDDHRVFERFGLEMHFDAIPRSTCRAGRSPASSPTWAAGCRGWTTAPGPSSLRTS